jgi:hypothetical protein
MGGGVVGRGRAGSPGSGGASPYQELRSTPQMGRMTGAKHTLQPVSVSTDGLAQPAYSLLSQSEDASHAEEQSGDASHTALRGAD